MTVPKSTLILLCALLTGCVAILPEPIDALWLIALVVGCILGRMSLLQINESTSLTRCNLLFIRRRSGRKLTRRCAQASPTGQTLT